MTASDQVRPKLQPLTLLRTIFLRLALILIGLAFGWLMLEIILRAGFDFLPPTLQGDIQSVQRVPWSDERIIPHIPWVIDNDFQLRLPPGMQNFPVHWSDARFTFNTISAWDGHRAGFRSNPPRWPLDVLTFGDSFTFCWVKLEDCWVHRLETDYDWHVFNAGIPGTGTTAQLNLMKEIAPPFKPALVVWQWYNNDVTDDYDLAHIRHETPDLGGPPAPDAPPEPQGLARYSAVYALLSTWLDPPPKTSTYKHYITVPINGRAFLTHTNEYPYGSSLNWPVNAYGWKRSVQSRDDAAALLQGLGAKMLLVVIPTKEEDYSSFLTQTLVHAYLDQLSVTRRIVLQQCADLSSSWLHTLPAFQDAIKNGQTIYYAFDSHLDASGNHLLEDLVHSYIVKNGLLPNKQ